MYTWDSEGRLLMDGIGPDGNHTLTTAYLEDVDTLIFSVRLLCAAPKAGASALPRV